MKISCQREELHSSLTIPPFSPILPFLEKNSHPHPCRQIKGSLSQLTLCKRRRFQTMQGNTGVTHQMLH